MRIGSQYFRKDLKPGTPHETKPACRMANSI
jgi:hypothetical protein